MPERPRPGEPTEPDEELLELRFVVPPDRHGWRLDRFLHDRIPRLSRSRLQKIIEEEACRPDGGKLKPAKIVNVGEVILLHWPLPEEPEAPTTFGVAYEDEDVLVVDKPAGLPVHPSARFHRSTLTWLLRQRYGDDRPIMAHRLDRETSGLVVCGRHRPAESSLKKQFEARTISKAYLAIVNGVPERDEMAIDIPLGPALGSAVRIRVGPRHDDAGLPASTTVHVLERFDGCALVRAKPVTGRQHQIRAHLAAVGHSVVGDKIYGVDEGIFIDYVDGGLTPDMLDRLELDRHALHAHSVAFDHPSRGTRVEVASPLPPDLEAYLDARRAQRDRRGGC